MADLRIADVIRLALTSTKFLSGACCRVRLLNISGWFSSVDAKNVTALLKRCTGLHEVHSYGSKPIEHDELTFALMAYCPSLRSIHLMSSRTLTDSAVAAMVRMYPGLVELRLANVEKLTDDALRAIAQHLPKLHRLWLEESELISDAGVVELVQKCTELKDVDLSSTSITDAAIIAIADNCADLEDLAVNGCENITDAALRVVRLPKLTNLDLEDCPDISDAGLIELSRQCTALKSLRISYASITDAAVSAVARNCPDIEVLDIDDTGVTVASVLAIARAPNLKSLNCYAPNCILTDEALYALGRGCKKLERLYFDVTKSKAHITRASVDALMAANPELKGALDSLVFK